MDRRTFIRLSSVMTLGLQCQPVAGSLLRVKSLSDSNCELSHILPFISLLERDLHIQVSVTRTTTVSNDNLHNKAFGINLQKAKSLSSNKELFSRFYQQKNDNLNSLQISELNGFVLSESELALGELLNRAASGSRTI